MQGLNKTFYNILSRKLICNWRLPSQFICFAGYDALIKLNRHTGTVDVVRNESLKIHWHSNLFIRDTLYSFYGWSLPKLIAYKYENVQWITADSVLERQEIGQTNDGSFDFSLANYQNKAIYVTGGARGGQIVNRVLALTIATKTFKLMPAMNVARAAHGSTSTGNILAVFGGNSHDRSTISSIEVLSVVQSNRWEKVEDQNQVFTPRSLPSVCAISPSKIIIYGGFVDIRHMLSDVMIFNPCDRSILKVGDTSLASTCLFGQNVHVAK